MPLTIDAARPSILIRRQAYESAKLARSELDSRFNLTNGEFRVEGNLVVIGPLPSDDLIGPITERRFFRAKRQLARVATDLRWLRAQQMIIVAAQQWTRAPLVRLHRESCR